MTMKERIDREALERKLAAAKDAIREMEEELAKSARPQPPVPERSIARWRKVFQSGSKAYNYAAVGAPLGWYMTGRTDQKILSWSELLDEIERDSYGTIRLIVNDFASGQFLSAWNYRRGSGWSRSTATHEELQDEGLPF